MNEYWCGCAGHKWPFAIFEPHAADPQLRSLGASSGVDSVQSDPRIAADQIRLFFECTEDVAIATVAQVRHP